jgi:hypothetical protein
MFVAVAAGYSWLAGVSFRELYGLRNGGTSNLEPVAITGRQQTVFKWRTQACEQRDIPDWAARAFRDAGGQVHLIASHYVSRQWIGPDLNHVRHRCEVIMGSTYDPRPEQYADKEWIMAPYTLDGRNVFALVHDEYQGYTHPGRCNSGLYLHCWYNAVTLARSTDGGRTFSHAFPPPSNLVAEVPYPYEHDAGPFGVFQPSNIVRKDGYYYSLVMTRPYHAQQGGTCLMRTRNLADPKSWRAWDGSGFSVTFVDPYTVAAPASGNHFCKPVSPSQISNMSHSLTFNTYFGKYLLVGPANAFSPRKRRVITGFYYSLSSDLVHWAQRKLIREAETAQTYRCGDSNPVEYPSVLDPNSRSRNFETTGRRPYLYFTRFHYSACKQTLDRDLVRVPIKFSK